MFKKRIILGAVVVACIAFAMLPTSAFAISREVVLARGKVWVNYVRTVSGKKVTGVPYSQAKWALESGAPVPTSTPSPSTAGYRTDCSGFVSLCYNLRDSKGRPYSECTAGFGAKGSTKYFQITKAQLTPGDMVLASAVWGAPGPHAIIFAGWVDAAQTQFWAMEQTSSSTHNGTILHPRSWADAVNRKFRPYRYVGLEDPFADVEEPIVGVATPMSAVAGSLLAFQSKSSPVAPAVVLANSTQWGDQLAGASLAGAVGGPVLLSSATSMPASTTAEIKRIKPKRVYVLGPVSSISAAVANQIGATGAKVIRINAANRTQLAARLGPITVAEDKVVGRRVDCIYLAPAAGPAEALAIAPVASRTGRPLLYTDKAVLPRISSDALKKMRVKKIVIVGGANVVSTAVEAKLKRLGYSVRRVSGKTSYTTSVSVANYAMGLKVGFSWSRVGIASPESCGDAVAYARTMGATNALILTTPARALDPTVRAAVIKNHSRIGRARVFGSAPSYTARKTLATAIRYGK